MSVSADQAWPGAGQALWRELTTHPGRLALVLGSDGADAVLRLFGGILGRSTDSVGQLLTAGATPPNPIEIPDILADSALLTDCQILFDPGLMLNPVALFRGLARTRPRIAVWPGRLEEHYLVYSEPTRRDYFSEEVRDALILRPRVVQFPDQVPYALERISP